MAVHPFATKCEKLLAALLRLEAGMDRVKDEAKKKGDESDRFATRISGLVQLGSIGGSGSAPAMVEFSHADQQRAFGKRKWTEFMRLKAKLAQAERECLERYLSSRTVNQSFDENGNPSGGQAVEGSGDRGGCPKARAIEKQLKALFGAKTSSDVVAPRGGT